MTESIVEERFMFRRPPVVERVLGALCNPDPNILATQMDTWSDLVKDHFPVVETATKWTLNIEEKDGVPQLAAAKPIIQMWHRHWRVNSHNERVACIQSRPDGFFVNLRRETGNTHAFDELMGDFETWLPSWQKVFSVVNFTGCHLLYVNELSEKVTPQFISEDRSLTIGNALRVFSNFAEPGPFGKLVLPYECKATLQLKDLPGATLSLHTKAAKQPAGTPPAVFVELLVQGRSDDNKISLPRLLDQCRLYHSHLLSGFRSTFTEHALSTFEPV